MARRQQAQAVTTEARLGRGGRRRARRRGFTVTVTVTALGAGLALGPDLGGGPTGDPRPIDAPPADNPALGLVYQALTPATADGVCVGGFTLADARTCTAGPDPAPPGRDVGRAAAPVAPAAPTPALPARDDAPPPRARDLLAEVGAVAPDDDTPGLAPARGYRLAGGVACAGDGRDGHRVQVLYLVEQGRSGRYSRYRESLRAWTVAAQRELAGAGAGGPVRVVTDGACHVEVREVAAPAAALRTFSGTVAHLRDRGYGRTDRKYLVFADAHVYCGIATADPAAARRGPSYARVDAGCWGTPPVARQLRRLLGAPPQGAAAALRETAFVLRDRPVGGPVRPLPAGALRPTPTPGPRPTPSPSALPSPPPGPAPTATPTPSPGPTAPPRPTTPPTGRRAQAKAVSPGVVEVSWPPAGGDTRYGLTVDGRAVGAITDPAARLVGLRPGRTHTVQVWVLGSRGRAARPHTDPAAVRARAAAPPPGGAVALVDTLTGRAAELAAGRPGAPAVLAGVEAVATQTWRQEAHGDGVRLVGADGRCLAPRGGAAAGAVVATARCSSSAAQRWRLRHGPDGVAVVSAASGLVLGAARPRFGEPHLLTVQRDRRLASQRWLALPAGAGG
ncbi:MAG TPA: ricin-type beta-trefoil lectin domain protein [Pilimelia sp.]|nr:ricin-type beta-trefoil lectin domain protein [Pilimelia sp.]